MFEANFQGNRESLLDSTISKDFSCPFENCCQNFPNKESLVNHFKSHVYKKCYHCTYPNCSKTFLSQLNLKKHARKHLKKKIYPCEFPGCEQIYNQIYQLTTHQRTHKGYRPYKCFQCSKTFMEKSFLKTHMRTHTGELPYKCKLCGSSFKIRQELKKHQEVAHGDTKPFACSKCTASFPKFNSLKVHQKIHSGHKPYTCPYPGCGKAFVEKGNMKTHFKVHDNFQMYLDLIDDATILKQGETNSHSDKSGPSATKLVQGLNFKTEWENNMTPANFNNIIKTENENEHSTASTKPLDDFLTLKNHSSNTIQSLFNKNQIMGRMNDFSTFLDTLTTVLTNLNSFSSKFYEISNDLQIFNLNTPNGCFDKDILQLKAILLTKNSNILSKINSIYSQFQGLNQSLLMDTTNYILPHYSSNMNLEYYINQQELQPTNPFQRSINVLDQNLCFGFNNNISNNIHHNLLMSTSSFSNRPNMSHFEGNLTLGNNSTNTYQYGGFSQNQNTNFGEFSAIQQDLPLNYNYNNSFVKNELTVKEETNDQSHRKESN